MSPRILAWLPGGVRPCCTDQVTMLLTSPYTRVWSRQLWELSSDCFLLSLLPPHCVTYLRRRGCALGLCFFQRRDLPAPPPALALHFQPGPGCILCPTLSMCNMHTVMQVPSLCLPGGTRRHVRVHLCMHGVCTPIKQASLLCPPGGTELYVCTYGVRTC